ncbi:MAG: hypothetical protein EA350_00720 [Gemmatimonadales bacterium]|nr:MAG: hypothetical protein EA350_00720 [Gemmatimonadales bacterium]
MSIVPDVASVPKPSTDPETLPVSVTIVASAVEAVVSAEASDSVENCIVGKKWMVPGTVVTNGKAASLDAASGDAGSGWVMVS